MNSSSTLVATVSINYEDFTEGFLTCGTCLYAYDQGEHSPKLLSCSHTICQNCLELIVATPSLNSNTEQGHIRCPICRSNIAIPNGGVSALPPSFLVNQLFDLVNKKPREFIPKCSVHIEQELLFCETCDCVFCDTCDSESGPTKQKHINETCTVIPFSTAIKRVSEILNYRSQQCAGKLAEADDNVKKEIEKLNSNCIDATAEITQAFQKIKSIVERREAELLDEVKKLQEYKKNILLEQLKTIESEKSTLSTNNSVKINNQSDVKKLTKKISDLSDKNETALVLFTPRENCFICFENGKEDVPQIENLVTNYGNLRTSKTYPPFCTSTLVHYATHLRSLAIVQSVDYNGINQVYGGDPINAELMLVGTTEPLAANITIKDKRDGTYEVEFTPPSPGKYHLYIYIFNRPIKNCPLTFETVNHHNPVAIFGSEDRPVDAFDFFSQPASLVINKHNGRLYVLDSFNFRIKVLAQIDSKECPFSFMNHISTSFFTRSCTGIGLSYPEEDSDNKDDIHKLCLSPSKHPTPTIIVSDWRNKKIYELTNDGNLVREIEHEEFKEPTTIAIDSRSRIFVVDRDTIFVFSSVGKLLFKLIGSKKSNVASDAEKDSSSIKKDIFDSTSLEKPPNFCDSTDNLASVKDLKNALNVSSLLINKPQNKSGTLSSLLSKRRKPKLNGATLQRGSKAVISAASRIRSTFTLSHSTSLVSAVSLQSMFGSGKHQSANNSSSNNNTSNYISNNIVQQVYHNDNQLAIVQQANSGPKSSARCTGMGGGHAASKFSVNNSVNNIHLIGSIVNSANMNDTGSAVSKQTAPIYEKDEHNLDIELPDDRIEPFGIIRGIAIGPDDELIVACESSIKVMMLTCTQGNIDEYVFKREIVQSRSGSQARICGLTYDANNDLLLCLYTDKVRSFIEIYDYYLAKSKFIIDSYDAKLIRPSSLAIYGQHVIVTDLGNNCIKKYRFC